MPERTSALDVHRLNARYGSVQVLWDVSLNVGEGERVGIVGINGSGKTSLLRGLMGHGPTCSGTVELFGKRVDHLRTATRIRSGMAMCGTGKAGFARLSVEQCLRLSMKHRQASLGGIDLDGVHSLFPRLRERRAQRTEFLSGGERQMLKLAMAFLLRPSVLLMDEMTEGLAPTLVGDLVRLLTSEEFASLGMSVLLCEQNHEFARVFCDRLLFLDQGVLSSDARKMGASDNEMRSSGNKANSVETSR